MRDCNYNKYVKYQQKLTKCMIFEGSWVIWGHPGLIWECKITVCKNRLNLSSQNQTRDLSSIGGVEFQLAFSPIRFQEMHKTNGNWVSNCSCMSLRVTKTLSACQQCWPESFCDMLITGWGIIWIIWKMSGCYTKYPDKKVWMIWKVSGKCKKCPENLENVSGSSGKCPDDLESFLII